jgi:ankyrin repeat protein
MTALHMAATINDVHVVDFILNSVEDPNRAVNIATNEGWTPSHFAGFLNNFDSLNLLLEHGSDLGKESNVGMSVVDEIIRVDNADLFECIFPHVKNMKRDTSKSGSFGLIHMAAG